MGAINFYLSTHRGFAYLGSSFRVQNFNPFDYMYCIYAYNKFVSRKVLTSDTLSDWKADLADHLNKLHSSLFLLSIDDFHHYTCIYMSHIMRKPAFGIC